MEHDTEKFKKHIIFPLCALSINLELNKLIIYLIDYALVQIAKKELMATEFKGKYKAMLVREMMYFKNNAMVFSKNNTVHHPELEQIEKKMKIYEKTKLKNYIIQAAKERKLNIRKKSLKRIILNHNVINYHKEKFEEKNEKDARVLMNLRFLYDIKKKNALSENEFRVLCAIYSCLGKPKYIFHIIQSN